MIFASRILVLHDSNRLGKSSIGMSFLQFQFENWFGILEYFEIKLKFEFTYYLITYLESNFIFFSCFLNLLLIIDTFN